MSATQREVDYDIKRNKIVQAVQGKWLTMYEIAIAVELNPESITRIIRELRLAGYLHVHVAGKTRLGKYTALKYEFPIRKVREVEPRPPKEEPIAGARIVRLEDRKEGWQKHELRKSLRVYASGAYLGVAI